MIKRLTTLFEKDKLPYNQEQINIDLLVEYDDFILSKSDNNQDLRDTISVYEKFQPMKQDAPEGMKQELFKTIRNYALEQHRNKQFISALILYRFLIVKTDLYPSDYSEIASILANYNIEFAKKFIEIYKKNETNKALLILECADFYKKIGDYKNSIKYYEKYVQIDTTKSSVFNILADLYSKSEGLKSVNKQIEYYLKAYKLKPDNRLAIHGLAFLYEEIGDYEKTKYFYQLLLQNNPTETDYYNYGMFLIHCGDLLQGHQYLTHRFNINDINLKYPAPEPRWDLISDIKDKILLIHYEQGFGDTIMYCRFVPYLKNFAKKIIFVVQDELYELIKNSEIMPADIDIISGKTDLNNIKFDYTMALLDTPYVVKTTVDTIPFKNAYLGTELKTQKNKTEKIKVGIAYSGDKNANYNGRDLKLSDFKFLTEYTNLELYSLQKDEQEKIEGIIPLGNKFDNFYTTAKIMKEMDIIISTDNVILNLSGALGIKTYGLFNKSTNFRWFNTTGQNVGWYNSVIPIQTQIQNDWSKVFQNLGKIISETEP